MNAFSHDITIIKHGSLQYDWTMVSKQLYVSDAVLLLIGKLHTMVFYSILAPKPDFFCQRMDAKFYFTYIAGDPMLFIHCTSMNVKTRMCPKDMDAPAWNT